MAIPFRVRIAKTILGSKAKDYLPSLNPNGSGLVWPGTGNHGDIKSYETKQEQLSANLNWSFTANRVIVTDCAAVELKVYRRKADGDREEVFDDKARAILDLLEHPNNFHTGEQMAQLHYTYMNFCGEAYTIMFKNGEPWKPVYGQLPDALQELPAHLCQFKLSEDGYSRSTVKYNNQTYPLSAFIRDINPDPARPFNGLSVIQAAATIINSDQQMRSWNNNLIANDARPGLIFKTNEPMDDEAYDRWREQFADEKTGQFNAGKPLLIEGGDVTPYMLSPKDLDFLKSREFTMKEILGMWNVSPYKLGLVENVNKASAEVFDRKHAKDNTLPRVRQWVRQFNITVVNNFDPTYEVDLVNPVGEDVEQKLAESKASVNAWRTIDEVRADYGLEPLDDDLGDQMYVPGTLKPLRGVADGSAMPAPAPAADPAAPEDEPADPDEQDGETKALSGVKKKT